VDLLGKRWSDGKGDDYEGCFDCHWRLPFSRGWSILYVLWRRFSSSMVKAALQPKHVSRVIERRCRRRDAAFAKAGFTPAGRRQR
jgi:hypothetical protein